ncbi:glycosyl hydrolase 2 galactose-binding domain-containing protein [Methylobacterium oryzae CBMB20]
MFPARPPRPCRRPGAGTAAVPEPIHDRDIWYRTRIAGSGPARLRFGGLATLAEVWLDGVPVLCSRSMFEEHAVDVDLGGTSDLALCFRALRAELGRPAKRGRWRPRMITPGSLRHTRTSVLGFMPGWCPEIDLVGPYRPLTVEPVRPRASAADVRPTLDGDIGRLAVRLRVDGPVGSVLLRCGGGEAPLAEVEPGLFAGALTLPGIAPWWPHTHGAPNLHPVEVRVDGARGRPGPRRLPNPVADATVRGGPLAGRQRRTCLLPGRRLDPARPRRAGLGRHRDAAPAGARGRHEHAARPGDDALSGPRLLRSLRRARHPGLAGPDARQLRLSARRPDFRGRTRPRADRISRLDADRAVALRALRRQRGLAAGGDARRAARRLGRRLLRGDAAGARGGAAPGSRRRAELALRRRPAVLAARGLHPLFRRRRLLPPPGGCPPGRGRLRQRVPRLRQPARTRYAGPDWTGRPALAGRHPAGPGRRLGFRDGARPLRRRALRRRSGRAARRGPGPLPRARPRRGGRGHGGDLRRVAPAALADGRRPRPDAARPRARRRLGRDRLDAPPEIGLVRAEARLPPGPGPPHRRGPRWAPRPRPQRDGVGSGADAVADLLRRRGPRRGARRARSRGRPAGGAHAHLRGPARALLRRHRQLPVRPPDPRSRARAPDRRRRVRGRRELPLPRRAAGRSIRHRPPGRAGRDR